MHSASKYFLLLGLVCTIYVLRDAEMSFTSPLGYAFRALQELKPTATLCSAIDITQAYSQDQIDRANSFKTSLQSSRGGNPLKDVIVSGDIGGRVLSDYAMPLIPLVAPWPVLFVISFLVCIGLVCNWCCMYGCCKSMKCCKCCKEPKDQKRKRVYIAAAALFLVASVGVSIAGIVIASGVPTGMDLTFCSALSVIEDLYYGVPSLKWIGLSPAITSLDDVLNKFDATVASLSSTSNSFATIDSQLAGLKTDLTNMYNARKNDVASRAAPDVTATYAPAYIANLGPPTNNQTLLGLIQAEFQIKRDVAATADPIINNAISQLQGQQTTIKSGINSGKTAMKDIANPIKNALETLQNTGGTAKDGFKGVGMGLQGIFIAVLVISIFTIASMVMVGFMKIKFFNKFLHFSWCLTMLFTIIGFILATLFYPISVVMMEACDVLDSVLNEQGFVGKIGLKGDIANVFDTCFHSEATGRSDDLLSVIGGLDSHLSQFDAIFAQLDNINAQMNIDTTTPPPAIVLPIQIFNVTQMRDGLVPDDALTVTDLTAFNAAINRNTNPCVTIADTWVLNSQNCSNDMGAKFVSSNPSTYDVPNPTCVGFEAWNPPGHDVTQRFTAARFPSSCSNIGGMSALSYAQSAVNKFETNRNQVSSIFSNVLTSLNTVNTNYGPFANSLLSILTPFKNVKTRLTGIRDSLIGEPNGLLKNLHCKWLKVGFVRVHQSMCVGFVSSVYQSSVVIIITSFFTLFSALSVFCLAKRFIVKDDNKKTTPGK